MPTSIQWEIDGGPPPFDSGLGIGTIGWDTDGGNPYSMGDSTNDGVTFVNVTMFQGKDPTVPLKAGVGQGAKLLCQISQDIIVLPSYGTKVLVASPQPAPRVAGHSIVISVLGNTQWAQGGNSTTGDLFIPCPLGPARIIMRQDGSITAVTDAADGTSVAMWLEPGGFHVQGPFGSLHLDKYGFRVDAGGGPSILLTNAGGLPFPLNLLAGPSATISAGTIKLDSLQVMAGPDAPTTNFMPVPVYNDAAGPPSPSPLLDALLLALAPYLVAVESILGSLLGQPQYTGVTSVQFAALETAKASLTAAFTTTAATLTSTTFKVAYPLPVPA